MNELTHFYKNLKKNFTPKISNPTKPVRTWSEKDLIHGKIVDAYVVILRTTGCSWTHKSGCTMCGYFNDSIWGKISDKELIQQFDSAMKNYSGERFVKIFTSGSFLDEKEIKPKVRDKILNRLSEKIDKLSIESRPEYITDERLTQIKEIFQPKKLEISIGLETSNDFIREHAINKGFTFSDYNKAVKILKKYKFNLKTYVLVKPPFLTEKEAIEDCKNTITKIRNLSDTISLNPTNVQRNTVVEYLWKRNQFRPPWLWSIVEILKKSKINDERKTIKCDIAGGGSNRGPHNCKKCNRMVLDAIANFSLSQNENVFDNLECECKNKWLDQIDFENLTFGSIVDFSGRYQ